MFFYTLLALFYLLCIPFENEVLKKIGRRAWAFLLFLPLFLLSAFRDPSVGSDTLSYMSMYNDFSQQPLFSPAPDYIEIGYIFINRVMGVLNINYYGFQILYSAFIYIILVILVSKYSKNIAFSIFIYLTFRLFFFSLNITRQMIAMMILMISLPFITKRKPVKFLITVFIATLIHNTALLFSLLYFLPKINIQPKNILKISVLTIVVIIGGNFFITLFINYFPKYSAYLYRIEDYDGSFVYIQTIIIFSFILLGAFLQASERKVTPIMSNNINSKFGVFPFGRREEKVNINKKVIKFESVIYSAVILSFAFSVLSLNLNIAGRISKYFVILIMIYLPNILELIKNKNLKFLISFIIICCLMIYYITILQLRPEWDGIIPYKLMWSI